MKRSCLLGEMSLFLKVAIYNCSALCFPHFSLATCVERQGFSNCSFQIQNKSLFHNTVPQCLGAASVFPSPHVTISICHENKRQSHFPIYPARFSVCLTPQSHPPTASFWSDWTNTLCPSHPRKTRVIWLNKLLPVLPIPRKSEWSE